MNLEKYIFFPKIEITELEKIIQEMADLYYDVEYTSGIEIYTSKTKTNFYIINFSQVPDFDRFKYFVNYIAWGENHALQNEVKGYWTINENDEVPSKHLNERTMLFVSELDEDGDNVYAAFENNSKNFKLGFAVGHEYEPLNITDKEFVETPINPNDFSLIKTINPNPELKKKELNSGCSLLFIIIAFLSGCLYF